MSSNPRTLILVKHSLPEIQPEIPACDWNLSAEGRQRCSPLADCLAPFQPTNLFCSQEPKATETARLTGERLGLQAEVYPGLHEHERHSVGWSDQAGFHAAVQRFFAHPAELVYGEETAQQALQRFWNAIHALTVAHPVGNLLVVAHGTVISLFVAQANNLAPFPFWKRLGLPSFVALSMPDLALLHTCEQIHQPPNP